MGIGGNKSVVPPKNLPAECEVDHGRDLSQQVQVDLVAFDFTFYKINAVQSQRTAGTSLSKQYTTLIFANKSGESPSMEVPCAPWAPSPIAK